MIQKIIVHFVLMPSRLFLIDSLGALLTAFLLFAILKPLHEYIGTTPTTLTNLSLIALAMSIYSISCSLLVKKKYIPFLYVISMANIIYCCLTCYLMIATNHNITILGIAYFTIEILVVLSLVYIELKTLSALRNDRNKKSFQ